MGSSLARLRRVNGFGPGRRDHACPLLRETASVYSRSTSIRVCHENGCLRDTMDHAAAVEIAEQFASDFGPVERGFRGSRHRRTTERLNAERRPGWNSERLVIREPREQLFHRIDVKPHADMGLGFRASN